MARVWNFFCSMNFLDGKRSIEKQIRFPGRLTNDPYNLCNRLSNAIVYSGQLFIVICFEWT